MGEITRGFKLFQPWATDVVRGKLNFLVRSIPTKVGGRVAVIATQGIDAVWLEKAKDEEIKELKNTLLIAFVVVTESDDEIGDTEIKKIKRRYKEYIVTVSEIPSSDESGKTVNVKSIDDLARMSDITGKPILHVPGSLQEGRKDVFCIIDGEVKYQYAPSENRHKPKKLELFYRKFY